MSLLTVFSDLLRSRPRVVGSFFALLVLLGLALHRDYGMGWDEPADKLGALVSAKYVALRLAPGLVAGQPRLAELPDLRHHADADHGVLFMLPLVMLEALWPGPGPAEWAYRRHLVMFLLFAAGAWAVYRLGWARLSSWRWGLAGAALLVLTPRLFAEAFYNSKDVVFLSLFALAMLTLTRLLRRPTAGRALLHAAATAAALDVRSMGILLLPLTLGAAALELLYRPPARRPLLGALAVYVPAAAALVVLGWPYLWEQPLHSLAAALGSFSHYQLREDVWYLGRFWSPSQLPWHYAPLWLLVTTPLPYVALFGLGLGGVLATAGRRGLGHWLRRRSGRHEALLLAWFFGPLLGVIVLRSALYDGWRHLYFIYPAFVLLAVQGLRRLWRAWRPAQARGGRWRRVAAGVGLAAVGAGTAQVARRMVAEHPFQYVYFSCVTGPAIERNFERDWWGLSVKQGLQWVLAHDARPRIRVSMDERTQMTLRINAKMLPPADRARLRQVPPDSAAGGYFLSIFRWHPGPYPASAGLPVHTIRVGGAAILTVRRRPGS